MSNYVCGGCGYYSDYKEDCYFYNEEHDMGARVPWCGYDRAFKMLNECPENCGHYIPKKNVHGLVRDLLEKRWYVGKLDGLPHVETASNGKSQWANANTVGGLIDILQRFDKSTKVCYCEGGGEIIVDCEADEPDILWF